MEVVAKIILHGTKIKSSSFEQIIFMILNRKFVKVSLVLNTEQDNSPEHKQSMSLNRQIVTFLLIVNSDGKLYSRNFTHSHYLIIMDNQWHLTVRQDSSAIKMNKAC